MLKLDFAAVVILWDTLIFSGLKVFSSQISLKINQYQIKKKSQYQSFSDVQFSNCSAFLVCLFYYIV